MNKMKEEIEKLISISPDLLKKFYISMLKIRLYEEKIAEYIENGKIKTPCHLYIGQEAIATGVCSALKKEDAVFSNYRGHGHYLAKGGDTKKMMAEIFCKSTGCSKGKGGSMHLIDTDVSIFGSTAIVSGQIAPAAGVAMKYKLLGEKNVSVVFLGDAGTEQGVFAETVNFAALKKLPIIFICENNDFAAHMRLAERQPIKKMSLKTRDYMPSFTIDGNNVKEIYTKTVEAVERAKRGEGPSFIECLTHRWRGHVGPKLDIDKGLRTKEELDYWISKCPIKKVETELLDEKIINLDEKNKIILGIEKEILEALAFAEESPVPKKEDLLKNIYAEREFDL